MQHSEHHRALGPACYPEAYGANCDKIHGPPVWSVYFLLGSSLISITLASDVTVARPMFWKIRPGLTVRRKANRRSTIDHGRAKRGKASVTVQPYERGGGRNAMVIHRDPKPQSVGVNAAPLLFGLRCGTMWRKPPSQYLDTMSEVGRTIGAVLVGSLVAAYLSGTVSMQALFYYRLYPDDSMRFKIIVSVIWVLDIMHTAMASASIWDYLIENWGSDTIFDFIPWTIAFTISITATITFTVQFFYAYRVYSVSRGNLYITIPIVVFATARIGVAGIATVEMIRLRSFEAFGREYGWAFALGLSLSSALDILVTVSLCVFLRRSRTGFSSMDRVINTLTLYTIQSGLLTCIVTIIALIFWLAIPHSLVFFGIHLAICKLYSNSLLATLNARRSLRVDVVPQVLSAPVYATNFDGNNVAMDQSSVHSLERRLSSFTDGDKVITVIEDDLPESPV
ncbi:hypothetical protein A0H81_11483 [Grifola frondosa]|uniref:DUF6534 domain-containing protein n=1 Tax=Grifola frondosa TaxID=5627 RepID=A0A1C7LUY6_GRIFR|nr:hypothetical protein A0H81_11483 [Grifola frondosa]